MFPAGGRVWNTEAALPQQMEEGEAGADFRDEAEWSLL